MAHLICNGKCNLPNLSKLIEGTLDETGLIALRGVNLQVI